MGSLLTSLMLFSSAAAQVSEREALLAADRALARATSRAGMTLVFVPALTDDALYLHPGAPLLRGRDPVRALLNNTAPLAGMFWTPAFADVSADGTLGYTYGWTQYGRLLGKYLACWRKRDGTWRISAYARNVPESVGRNAGAPLRLGGPPTAIPTPTPKVREPARSVGGPSDPTELLRADSAFARASAARGPKQAFIAFAASDAITFGTGMRFNEGPEAIGAAFDRFPDGAALEWVPLAADIAGSGDLGCTVGEAVIAARRRYTKYLTVWKRQADGAWKFVADGGNTRPVPDSTAAPSGTPPPED